MTNTQNLIERQLATYPESHNDKTNLWIHAFAVPIFMAGTIALLVTPLMGIGWAAGGIAAMAVSMAAQARGHAREVKAPSAFQGPLDVVLRIFSEQWITFPRFVIRGGLARNRF